MNRPTLFTLIALNALFSFVLIAELAVSRDGLSTQKTANSSANQNETDELPNLDLTGVSEENYADLVERPLFIKGRRPVDEPEPETTPVAVVKKVEAFNWELTGIFTTSKGKMAFFSRTGAKAVKDNYRKQKVNDEIDGWKVSEIAMDSVKLTQPNDMKSLPLRKVKPKMPVAPINPPNRVQLPSATQIPPPPQPQMQQPETIHVDDETMGTVEQ